MTEQIWELQEGEPNEWFDRFTRYRLMGVSRSIEAVFKAEKTTKRRAARPNASWYTAAQEWNWKNRAVEWDKHERLRLAEEHEQARKAAKNRRQKIITDVERLLTERISTLIKQSRSKGRRKGSAETAEDDHYVSTPELLTLANATKTILDQSRVEFGEPTAITGVIDGGPSEVNDTREKLQRLLSSLTPKESEGVDPQSNDGSGT